MSYAKSLGKEEEKRYAKALERGGAATYVDELGQRLKGTTEETASMAEGYRSIYETELAANAAAAEMNAQQAREERWAAEKQLSADHAASNRGLYRQYRKALQSLPQELAAMGYSGGSSESSRVELERGYQEGLIGSERQRLAAATELRGAETEALRAAAQTAAEADAAARREYLGALLSLQGDALGREREKAEQLAAAGDFSGYEKLGYSSGEIARLRLAWEAGDPDMALAIDARSGRYSAEEVAAMPVEWVKRYLNALGYALEEDGRWDRAAEEAFRAAFGTDSGKAVYYSASAAQKEKEKEEEAEREKTDGKSAGDERRRVIGGVNGRGGTVRLRSTR